MQPLRKDGEAEVRLTPDGETCYAWYGRPAGEALPVVLIHGVGMAQRVWAPQVASLAADRGVLVYDMLGHGGSRRPAPDATLGDYAGQLERLLDHLGVPRVAVAGHSMGALVAMEFALSRPQRVARVAALNAVFQRDPAQRAAVRARARALNDEGADAAVAPTLRRWFDDPVPDRWKDAARLAGELLSAVDPQGYATSYRLFAESDDAHAAGLAGLAMPALFLTGEEDGNSSPAMSREMAARAPLGMCEILPCARHMMTLTHPDEVNARLKAFLAALTGGGKP